LQHGRPLYWLGNILKPLCFRTASRVDENRFVVPQHQAPSYYWRSAGGRLDCARISARSNIAPASLLLRSIGENGGLWLPTRPVLSRGLRCPVGSRLFHGPQVEIEQTFARVPLLLVLPSWSWFRSFMSCLRIFTSKPSPLASANTSFFCSFNSCSSASIFSIRSTNARIVPPGMVQT
jgi:hypothetical protein